MKIIFDLFGVLLSSGFLSSKKKLVNLFNKPAEQIAPVYKKWERPFDLGQIDSKTFWGKINSELNTDVNWHHLEETVLNSYVQIPGSFELLEKCGEVADLYLLSNTRREWFEFLNNKYHISKYFKKIFLSYELSMLKPNPLIYRRVLSELEPDKKDLLYIDDENINVNAALQIGIKAIRFNNPFDTFNQINLRNPTPLLSTNKVYSGILFISNSGEFVLQRRDDKPGISNRGLVTTFGGMCLDGESTDKCVIREIGEELCIKLEATNLEFLALFGKPEQDRSWTKCCFYWMYGVEKDKLKIREGERIEFLKITEALKYPDLSPVCREVIKHYLEYVVNE